MHSHETHLDYAHEFDGDGDALVQRLRRLAWPTVSAEDRRRCWDEFSRMMSDARLEDPAERRNNTIHTHEYSRVSNREIGHLVSRRLALAGTSQMRIRSTPTQAMMSRPRGRATPALSAIR
jgi:hypothetical protein